MQVFFIFSSLCILITSIFISRTLKVKRQVLESEWKQWVSVAQSCLTISNPTDCSPPGSSVHRIFQTVILEWVAISFFRGSSWPRDWTWVSCIVGRILPSEPPGKPRKSITDLKLISFSSAQRIQASGPSSPSKSPCILSCTKSIHDRWHTCSGYRIKETVSQPWWELFSSPFFLSFLLFWGCCCCCCCCCCFKRLFKRQQKRLSFREHFLVWGRVK